MSGVYQFARVVVSRRGLRGRDNYCYYLLFTIAAVAAVAGLEFSGRTSVIRVAVGSPIYLYACCPDDGGETRPELSRPPVYPPAAPRAPPSDQT